MPTNLYGPNDNFDLAASHVVPALMRKIHEAKIAGAPDIEVWGTGRPSREFLHVDDLAKAVAFCLDNYDEAMPINCGAPAYMVSKDFLLEKVRPKLIALANELETSLGTLS